MKSILVISAIAFSTLGMAGCSVGDTANKLAGVVAHSQLACSDLAQLGGDVNSIAQQVASANPNNAQVQSIAAKVAGGVALGNSDCQTLAASFKAMAPESKMKLIAKINTKALANIK
jgi:outer membrane murein-binding lipoprotein Lpp